MSTPLSGSLGHLYTKGQEATSGTLFPVWLAIKGTRIMGGIIDLNAELASGIKVGHIYPEIIRTGTMCAEEANKNIKPIPTFRVLEPVSAAATTVTIAKWYGLAQLVQGMTIQPVGANSKSVVIDLAAGSGNTVLDAEGNYVVTITANALGALTAESVLIMKEAVSLIPMGLTDETLPYKGADITNSTVNVTLVDEGRILKDLIAPIHYIEHWSKFLQSVKLQ